MCDGSGSKEHSIIVFFIFFNDVVFFPLRCYRALLFGVGGRGGRQKRFFAAPLYVCIRSNVKLVCLRSSRECGREGFTARVRWRPLPENIEQKFILLYAEAEAMGNVVRNAE